jgi:hypothetical protein
MLWIVLVSIFVVRKIQKTWPSHRSHSCVLPRQLLNKENKRKLTIILFHFSSNGFLFLGLELAGFTSYTMDPLVP